jgi:hypothetical protein
VQGLVYAICGLPVCNGLSPKQLRAVTTWMLTQLFSHVSLTQCVHRLGASRGTRTSFSPGHSHAGPRHVAMLSLRTYRHRCSHSRSPRHAPPAEDTLPCRATHSHSTSLPVTHTADRPAPTTDALPYRSRAGLLLYSSTPLLLYSSTPLLLYSSTPLLLYSSTPLLLYSSSTPLLLYSSTRSRISGNSSTSRIDG